MLRRPTASKRHALLVHRARLMLAAPTPSEQRPWSEALSARQLSVTFRRQVPLGGRFIADFYCASCRLVVEVDGGYHSLRSEADARRDRALRKLGYRVLRLGAELVERDLARSVELVREAIVASRL